MTFCGFPANPFVDFCDWDIVEPSNIFVKSITKFLAHPRFRGITSGIPPLLITSSIADDGSARRTNMPRTGVKRLSV